MSSVEPFQSRYSSGRRWHSYRIFLSDLQRSNGWRLPSLIGLMSIVAFSDGLAVMFLMPLLVRAGVAGSPNSTAVKLINEVLALITPAGSGVGAVLVIILILAAGQMAFNIFQGRWSAELIHRYQLDWQMKLFGALLYADWIFVTGRKGGELASATITETGRLGGAFYYFTLLTSTSIACAIYFLLAMVVSWRATLLLLILVVVMVASISWLYRISYGAGQQAGPLNASLQTLVNECLSGAKIIKATDSERLVMERVRTVSQALNQVGRVRLYMPSIVRGAFEFMSFSAVAIFFAYGMVPLHVGAAEILVILALFMRLLPKLTTSQTLVHDLNAHIPAASIVQGLYREASLHAERTSGADVDFDFKLPVRLEVEDLQAAYDSKPVLSGLNLTLNIPGMVGIVGGSGAGKSTLVHALLGLITPSMGHIRLGGHELATTSLSAWRRKIGYVPQETLLFHASVADNLALAAPGATRAEIIEAARAANAHDFIMALPEGYDTSIGDQGVLLSGGQRQRLGIARALAAKPALLLLDEPTSALDPHAENEVLASLEKLRKSVGIVIVAHRLTTVQSADNIYVLEGGRVVESGSWLDLIERRSRFHALAKLQQVVA